MQTLTVQGIVTGKGMLRIEAPCNLPPGPVEAVVTIRPHEAQDGAPFDWDSLYGIAKGVWADIDSVEYVRELREDREPPP
jgi:hypothetical protein